MRIRLSAATAVALMTAASIAQADESAAGAAVAAEAPAADAAAASEQSAGAGQLEEVMVTAQKRTQSIQDVPISVTAVSATELQRADVDVTSDLPNLSPALTFSSGFMPGVTSFNVRGLGTYVYRIGVEPAISVVRDGIPLARPADFVSELGDIERAEVLSGPQGTLFGRNATAGVINITRQSPTDTLGGYLDVKGTRGDALDDFEGNAKGAINIPVSDRIQTRLAAFYSNNSSYIENFAPNGASDIGLRHAYGLTAKVDFKLTQASSLLLTFDKAELHQTNGSPEIFVPLQAYQLHTVPTITAKQTALFGPALGAHFAADDFYPFNQHQNLWSIDADYTWDIATNLKFKSLSGYHTDIVQSQSNFYPGPSTPEDPLGFDLVGVRKAAFNPNDSSRQTKWAFVTHEDRVEYTGQWLDAVGGLYYSNITEHEQIDLGRLRSAAALGPAALATVGTPKGPSASYPYFYGNSYTQAGNTSEALAGFLDLTGHLTDTLNLFAGVRVSRDSLRFNFWEGIYNNVPVQPGVNFDPATDSPTVPYGSTLAFAGSQAETNTARRAGLAWKITPDLNAYASYNHSYIGAGVDLSAATAGTRANPNAALLKPSESNSYEAGLKSELLNHRLRLNLAVFSAKTRDAQVSALVTGTSTSRVQNAGNIETYGSEFSVDVLPVDALQINAGVAYLHSKFTNLTAPCYPGQTFAQGCNVAVGATFVERIDGLPSLDAPKWKMNVAATYDITLPRLPFDMYVRGDYRYQTKVYYQLDHDPFAVQDAFGIVNLAVGFTDHSRKYDLRLFTDNVTNQYYCPNEVNGPLARQECQSTPIDAQRRYGLEVSAHF
jgi:iron complex outermembrane receptor protein